MGYEQDFNLQLFQTILCAEMKYFSLMRYFLLLIIVWFYGMGISDFSDDAPHGIHFIRQTDGLAFTLHYWKTNDPFLDPGTLNWSSQDAKAACEFPLFYFLTAKSFSIWGVDFGFLRLMHGLISIMGLFALWGITGFFIRSNGFRLLVILSLFTVTVFNYYAFNFLPDTPAFSLVLLGYYFAMRYFFDDSKVHFFLSIAAFALASLLKITFLIHPLALIMAIAWTQRQKRIMHFLVWLLLILFPVFLWWFFVLKYNSTAGDTYFTTGPKGIWSMDGGQIYRVWEAVSKHWRNSYFPKYSWYGLGGMLIFLVAFWHKIQVVFRAWFLLLSLGGVCYALMFWQQLEHHDYYFLNVLPWFLLVFLMFFHVLENAAKVLRIRQILIFLFFCFTVSSLVKARDKMTWRMSERTEEENPALLAAELRQINPLAFESIENEKLWVIGEKTKNGVFVQLQSQGITQPIQFNDAFAQVAAGNGISRILLLSNEENALLRLKELGWRVIAEDKVHQTMLLDHP